LQVSEGNLLLRANSYGLHRHGLLARRHGVWTGGRLRSARSLTELIDERLAGWSRVPVTRCDVLAGR